MGYTSSFLDVRTVDANTVDIYLNNVRTFRWERSAGTRTKLYGNNASAPYISIVDGDSIALVSGDSTRLDIVAGGDIELSPHAGFDIKFGTYTADAALASTGYITIKDAAGNSRKLMVQA